MRSLPNITGAGAEGWGEKEVITRYPKEDFSQMP